MQSPSASHADVHVSKGEITLASTLKPGNWQQFPLCAKNNFVRVHPLSKARMYDTNSCVVIVVMVVVVDHVRVVLVEVLVVKHAFLWHRSSALFVPQAVWKPDPSPKYNVQTYNPCKGSLTSAAMQVGSLVHCTTQWAS